jgi:hypothetical protein
VLCLSILMYPVLGEVHTQHRRKSRLLHNDLLLYCLANIDHALTGSDNDIIYTSSVKNLVQSAMEGYNGQ